MIKQITCLVAFFSMVSMNDICAQQKDVYIEFKLKKRKIEFYIDNRSSDTISLPSQAYFEKLPKEAVEVKNDTLFLKFEREQVILMTNGREDKQDGLFFSDFQIPPFSNRVLEFRFSEKILKPKCISILVVISNGAETDLLISFPPMINANAVRL